MSPKRAFAIGASGLYVPTAMNTQAATEEEWRWNVEQMLAETRQTATTQSFYAADLRWRRNVINADPALKTRRIELYSALQAGFIALRAVAKDFNCEPDDAEGLDAMAAAQQSVGRIYNAIDPQHRRSWGVLEVRLRHFAQDPKVMGFLRNAQAAIAFQPEGWEYLEKQLAGMGEEGVHKPAPDDFDQRRTPDIEN